ncbi:MAG: hypothetical protein JO161_09325 [Planctomycetaceae bacterium]|nr:hypothetical protein [Planctomycetaceae bacterium]
MDDQERVKIDPKNNFPPSHQSPTATPSYRMLRQTIRDVFQKPGPGGDANYSVVPVVVPFLVTAGTDARFYEESATMSTASCRSSSSPTNWG